MKAKKIGVAVITSALISVALSAEPAGKPSSPEATAITNQVADYVKAYNAGDAKGLAQYFADSLPTYSKKEVTRQLLRRRAKSIQQATLPPTPRRMVNG